MCFSFIYTEKTVKVVKEYDDIMIELKKVEDSYKIEPVNAYILDKTIIPGLNGKKIDIDKSYSKMKRYGKFNESLITFVETAPDVSIKNNYDKFVISGNETKNQVSFIFLATKNTDLSKILSILKQKNTLANIFIDFN
jgi:hypothetical protein